MDPFKAYLVEQQDGKIAGRFVQFSPEQFDRGEVTLRIAYSSINYKDALAATGAGKIIRRYPCVAASTWPAPWSRAPTAGSSRATR